MRRTGHEQNGDVQLHFSRGGCSVEPQRGQIFDTNRTFRPQRIFETARVLPERAVMQQARQIAAEFVQY